MGPSERLEAKCGAEAEPDSVLQGTYRNPMSCILAISGPQTTEPRPLRVSSRRILVHPGTLGDSSKDDVWRLR